jgi:hypothetical protein
VALDRLACKERHESSKFAMDDADSKWPKPVRVGTTGERVSAATSRAKDVAKANDEDEEDDCENEKVTALEAPAA